jgi:hypothetical protein
MNINDALTQALIDYINDVKPFHTKFRETASQIFFEDQFNVNVSENYIVESHFKNSWGRDDLGGFGLQKLSEGDLDDATYTLPATVFSNFSLNDGINVGQTPVGNDPATLNADGSGFPFIDSGDGIPDSETPWEVTAGSFIVGNSYTIVSIGSTDFSLIGATVVTAGSLSYGRSYMILAANTTDFTLVGSDSNTAGTIFQATGHGVGTGTVYELRFTATGPGTGTGKAALNTFSHQMGSNQIPVEAKILSVVYGNTSFSITFDASYEATYGFDPNLIRVTVNDQEYDVADTAFFVKTSTPVPGYTNAATITMTIPGGLIAPANRVTVTYLSTGRFLVPFHQGSRVRVDGSLQQLGVHYVIDKTRTFIQFLPNRHPRLSHHVDINLMKSDKLFICKHDPFAYRGFQDTFIVTSVSTPGFVSAGSLVIGLGYTIMTVGTTDFTQIGAASNTVGLTFTATGIGAGTGAAAPASMTNLRMSTKEILAGFSYIIISADTADLTMIGANDNLPGTSFTASANGNILVGSGSVVPSVTCSVQFNNADPLTHKAQLTNVITTASAGTVWTLTAIGPWTFQVQKTSPLSSTTTKAYFKVPYGDGELSFTLDRTWVNYYVSDNVAYVSYDIQQDVNSYYTYDESLLGTGDGYGAEEFFPNLDSVTEHGVVSDPVPPIHSPVRFNQFGIVSKTSDGSYKFIFDTIPPRYTYVEFKVEKADQYNPSVRTAITEDVKLYVTYDSITEGGIVAGNTYVINSVGFSDFTAIGAPSNTVGVMFLALLDGNPFGSGTVSRIETVPLTP